MNYNDASLVITPNGFKAGKLYAVKGADLSVTRATSDTRVNANGVIETVGANVPRNDYTGGGCPSLLVEPQRTNSILNSANVANQTIITGAVAYTLSFYGSGTITLSGTHTATVVGLGTARKTYTFTPTAGILILTVSGTCTNGQLEASSYATSYIPTTSAIVTRNADVISKTGISSLIGQTEGTVLWDIYIETPTAADNENILNMDNGSFGNTIYIQKTASASISAEMYYGGSVQASFSKSSIVKGRYKCAFAYSNNNTVFFVNGVQVGSTDTSCSVPATSRLQLGQGALGFSNGNINLTTLWKTRLTNAELSAITTL
jgi:hypothetical protein